MAVDQVLIGLDQGPEAGAEVKRVDLPLTAFLEDEIVEQALPGMVRKVADYIDRVEHLLDTDVEEGPDCKDLGMDWILRLALLQPIKV